jgi:hypothetical protein
MLIAQSTKQIGAQNYSKKGAEEKFIIALSIVHALDSRRKK